MKKKRLLYTALSIIFGTGLIFSAVLSMQHWKNAAFSTVEVKFYYPDNQALVVSSEVEPLITSFLAAQPDSIALKTPAFLLETSLEALPYVADAQVYWNLNESLVVTVFMNDQQFLLTQTHELLPAPRQTPLDLPIITGVNDSTTAARAGTLLDVVFASPAFTSDGLAQMEVNASNVVLIPQGYTHRITANTGNELAGDLRKLSAYYAATPTQDLEEIRSIDLRYKNQVVSTTR
jgi:cell division septal protein FtsQ